MARETKLQVWNKVSSEVSELFESTEVSIDVQTMIMDILESNIKPKASGSINPPKEIDGIMHYYCRFHETYEPQENMVMSKDKSKGYCKASISIWNKMNSSIKKFEAKSSEALIDDEFENAKEFANSAKVLKAKLNDPTSYNLTNDRAIFNA